MKAAVIHRYGGNDVVRVEDVPEPVPGPGDLLVAVRAASVNPIDFKTRSGQTRAVLPYTFPLVLGSDLSGVVVGAGPGVTRFKEGDEVYARLDKERIGSFAERALVRETSAALKPRTAGHVEAASLPPVGLTSWQALVDTGRVQAGHRVLVQAGAEGVGTFAIQLAKHLGATVATTASSRNGDLVRSLGADVVVDYRTTRFEDVLSDYDFVFDTQGGSTLRRAFTVVKRAGAIVGIGGMPDAAFAREWGLNPATVAVLALAGARVSLLSWRHGVRYGYLFMRPSGAQLEQIAALVDAGAIRPVVDRVFPLDQIREALAHTEAGHARGKVVVSTGAAA